ncbi:MAG: PAS domain-containing protein [Desulfobacterales bacterium]|nr:PAS domain-containing protein [Desulfobacterales bacterium]
MKKKVEINNNLRGLPLNLAIIGGGRACKFFLELFRHGPSNFLNINIVGVCDINPEAEGFRLAEEMGIYTTDNFLDLFKINDLNGVIELTGNRDVLLELIRLRPKGIGVLEHNIGKFLRDYVDTDQKLKTAEQQVALEKMASDFLIQQANERIVVLRPDFTIADANEPYLKAVRKSKEEVLGAHCYKVIHGLKAPCSSSHPESECPLVESLKTGKSAHIIHEHPTKNHEPIYSDMVTYPIKNREGEIVRIIEIYRDITEEISSRWENRVKEMKADIKKMIQEDRMISLGKLVASSVHEINNPIQGLLTFSHLMQDILAQGEPSPDDLKEFQDYLSLMADELERCGNIVSGLLSFSRQSEMEYKNVDINEILEQIITLTRHKMEIRDIRLSVKLFSGPLMINGDVNQLQQCFLNLVFNAIEAMPRKGELNITSWLDEERKKALVEIRDTGYGIPEENLDQIFDPFFTTKEEGQGTGMGLSIVHGIIKNHRGDIKVNSRTEKGTSFMLTFPIS